MSAGDAIAGLVEAFRAKGLLLHASAIAFRVLVAAIPATLFAIAVLGSVGLEELWREEAAPAVRDSASNAVYTLLDDVVTRVLESRSEVWITLGALLAVASMASVIDAVSRTLNEIHDAEEDRPLGERAANAAAIGAGAGVLFLGAVAAVRLGAVGLEALLGDALVAELASFAIRWAVAGALLIAAVTLIARVGPDIERPLGRVGVGAAITVAGWIATSLAFWAYLETIAAYDTIFGNLATAYVLVQYVALSAIVFVGGLVLDAVAMRGGDRLGDGEAG